MNRLKRQRAFVGLAVVTLLAQAVWAQDGKDVKPSIHPELKEHSRQFDKKIFKIADNVYSAVGWDLANTIMVEGDNGLIIVDTGTGIDAARELEGTLDTAVALKSSRQVLSSPDLIAALSVQAWVEGFTTRLKAEQTLDVKMTFGFSFPDINENCALEIRRGVAQFHERMPEKTDATITLDKRVLNLILAGGLTFADAFTSGRIRVAGASVADVQRFFGYFEQPFTTPIDLTVR